MRTFFHVRVNRRNANILVQPTAQARIRTLCRQFTGVYNQHQTFAFALRCRFCVCKCCVNFRFQFIRFRLFTENLRESVNAFFAACQQIFCICRHFNRRRDFIQLVNRLIRAAACNNQLRLKRVQRFVIRLKQCANVRRFLYHRFQIFNV